MGEGRVPLPMGRENAGRAERALWLPQCEYVLKGGGRPARLRIRFRLAAGGQRSLSIRMSLLELTRSACVHGPLARCPDSGTPTGLVKPKQPSFPVRPRPAYSRPQGTQKQIAARLRPAHLICLRRATAHLFCPPPRPSLRWSRGRHPSPHRRGPVFLQASLSLLRSASIPFRSPPVLGALLRLVAFRSASTIGAGHACRRTWMGAATVVHVDTIHPGIAGPIRHVLRPFRLEFPARSRTLPG